jgi:phosphoglycolate phosphatase
MNKNIFFLWDIDGTLLDSKGAGVKPFVDAIKKHLGFHPNFEREKFSGFTDYEIARHFTKEISPIADVDAKVKNIVQGYEEGLSFVLEKERCVPRPGIADVLLRISNTKGYVNCVATGNTKSGAISKLKSSNLLQHFDEEKLFTSDISEDRVAIVAEAVKFARSQNGIPYVIGDTKRDALAAIGNKIDYFLFTNNLDSSGLEYYPKAVFVDQDSYSRILNALLNV